MFNFLKKKHPLKEALSEIIEAVFKGNTEAVTDNVRVGFALLLIRYHEEVTAPETDDLLEYFDAAGIPTNSKSLANAIKVVQENELMVNGKLNFADEEIQSVISWALYANLFEGLVMRRVVNGKAEYRITQNGKDLVENTLLKRKE